MDRKHVHLDLAIPWPKMRFNRASAGRFLPSPGSAIFTLAVVGLLLWAQSAGAIPLPGTPANVSSSSNTIAYQGRLADANGAPLTGTYSIIFRLYSAASGGVPLWEEQWTGSNGVSVSDGLFNVMLGSLTPIPQAVVTGNNTLWLGITVGTDDEMAPRVQLGSVPFAVQALTMPDGSVTTVKIADQAVTQAKLGPDVNLVPPDGSISTEKLADGAVTSRKLRPAISAGSQINLTYTEVETEIANNTVTLDVVSNVLIFWSSRHMTIPSGGTDFLLKRNSTVLASSWPSTSGQDLRTLVWLDPDLPAGTYTYHLTARAGAPGTYAMYDAKLIVIPFASP